MPRLRALASIASWASPRTSSWPISIVVVPEELRSRQTSRCGWTALPCGTASIVTMRRSRCPDALHDPSWGDRDQARGGKMGTGRSSLDHFIGLGEQRRRHHQADGLLIPSARGWNTAN
jgi:hypothetical protein